MFPISAEEKIGHPLDPAMTQGFENKVLMYSLFKKGGQSVAWGKVTDSLSLLVFDLSN